MKTIREIMEEFALTLGENGQFGSWNWDDRVYSPGPEWQFFSKLIDVLDEKLKEGNRNK